MSKSVRPRMSGIGREPNISAKIAFGIEPKTLRKSSHASDRCVRLFWAPCTAFWIIWVCSWISWTPERKLFCSGESQPNFTATLLRRWLRNPEKILYMVGSREMGRNCWSRPCLPSCRWAQSVQFSCCQGFQASRLCERWILEVGFLDREFADCDTFFRHFSKQCFRRIWAFLRFLPWFGGRWSGPIARIEGFPGLRTVRCARLLLANFRVRTYKNILVVSDNATRYVITIPMADQTAETVA